MAKVIRSIFKNDTISLTECSDGFWLYDYIIGMNISMHAKTEQAAFIEGLLYYQKNLKESKRKYKDIFDKVDDFIQKFDNDDYDLLQKYNEHNDC